MVNAYVLCIRMLASSNQANALPLKLKKAVPGKHN